MTPKERAVLLSGSFNGHRKEDDAFERAMEEYGRLEAPDRELVNNELVSLMTHEEGLWDLSGMVTLVHVLNIPAERDILAVLRRRFSESELRRLTSTSPQKGGIEKLLLGSLLATLISLGSSEGIEIARELQDKFGDTWVGRTARGALSNASKKKLDG
jgi:hypothetical protein